MVRALRMRWQNQHPLSVLTHPHWYPSSQIVSWLRTGGKTQKKPCFPQTGLVSPQLKLCRRCFPPNLNPNLKTSFAEPIPAKNHSSNINKRTYLHFYWEASTYMYLTCATNTSDGKLASQPLTANIPLSILYMCNTRERQARNPQVWNIIWNQTTICPPWFPTTTVSIHWHVIM